jgi:serine/threonine protein kinase
MAVAPSTAEEYLHLLGKSGLVDPPRLAGYLLTAGCLPASASELAEQLAADSVLTRFQASQLLAGKWRGFFLGKYRVLEPIASGGMGRVLLCEHTVLERRVALKVVPMKTGTDSTTLRRFHREGRAVAALDHPNIVRAYDMGHEGTLVYLAMEYVEGESLTGLVNRRGPLPVGLAAECVRQAALGLQHAHDAGWVHRDVKPDNLLLTTTGVVKILDLGLARSLQDSGDSLTRNYEANHILGTLDYLSPEQVQRSSEIDGRSDIYSLGATFYFLLTGGPPFQRGVVAQKLLWHLIEDVPPVRSVRPGVPAEIDAMVQRMLAKDPAQRFQRPDEVAQALAEWASPEDLPTAREGPGTATLRSPVSRTPRPAPASPGRAGRGRPVRVGIGLAVVLLGAILAGMALWSWARPGLFPAAVLSPTQALDRIGQQVTVEMEVQSVGVNRSGSLFYLNSEENYRDRSNFTVVIPRELLGAAEADVASLRQTYLNRRVRAVGLVTRYRSQAQIVIEDMAQVHVVTAP